jgi:hypothetical protein
MKEKQNINNPECKLNFYKVYYDCWVFAKTEEERLSLTERFIRVNNLKTELNSKEYYWEHSNLVDAKDAEKFVWMYNFIESLLNKESKVIKKYIRNRYTKEDIEWNLEWNDELPD